MTPQEETLQYALQDFGLRALPKEWKPNSNIIMIDGIAEVLKVGNIREYVKVSYDGHKVSINRDYGQCLAIVKIEKIYAVNTVDKSILPDLRSDKQIIQYLCKSVYNVSDIEKLLSKEGKTPEQIKADREVIKGYINDLALKYQKRKLAEEKRVKSMGYLYGNKK